MLSWEALSAGSSLVATVVVIIAAKIALQQAKEALSTRQLHETMGVIQQLQSGSLRTSRSFLKRRREEIEEILESPTFARNLDAFLRIAGTADGGPSSLGELRKDLASLEFIAIMSLHGRIPIDLERTHLAPTLTSYWNSVEYIVLRFREVSRFDTYLQHFEAWIGLVESGELYRRDVAKVKRREVARLTNNVKTSLMRQYEPDQRGTRGDKAKASALPPWISRVPDERPGTAMFHALDQSSRNEGRQSSAMNPERAQGAEAKTSQPEDES